MRFNPSQIETLDLFIDSHLKPFFCRSFQKLLEQPTLPRAGFMHHVNHFMYDYWAAILQFDTKESLPDCFAIFASDWKSIGARAEQAIDLQQQIFSPDSSLRRQLQQQGRRLDELPDAEPSPEETITAHDILEYLQNPYWILNFLAQATFEHLRQFENQPHLGMIRTISQKLLHIATNYFQCQLQTQEILADDKQSKKFREFATKELEQAAKNLSIDMHNLHDYLRIAYGYYATLDSDIAFAIKCCLQALALFQPEKSKGFVRHDEHHTALCAKMQVVRVHDVIVPAEKHFIGTRQRSILRCPTTNEPLHMQDVIDVLAIAGLPNFSGHEVLSLPRLPNSRLLPTYQGCIIKTPADFVYIEADRTLIDITLSAPISKQLRNGYLFLPKTFALVLDRNESRRLTLSETILQDAIYSYEEQQYQIEKSITAKKPVQWLLAQTGFSPTWPQEWGWDEIERVAQITDDIYVRFLLKTNQITFADLHQLTPSHITHASALLLVNQLSMTDWRQLNHGDVLHLAAQNASLIREVKNCVISQRDRHTALEQIKTQFPDCDDPNQPSAPLPAPTSSNRVSDLFSKTTKKPKENKDTQMTKKYIAKPQSTFLLNAPKSVADITQSSAGTFTSSTHTIHSPA